jgi:tRNA pseudouridine38-40 synthase
MPAGTGRTDAGVHAMAQGVLVQLAREWDPYRLLAALNAHLPWDARVMAVQRAPEGFFPRAHAVAKRYVYRIQEGPAADPFHHLRRWHVFGAEPLDRAAMAAAAGHLVGAHDFSSFRHSECAALSPHKVIHRIGLAGDGAALDLAFEGNRFLMHMVRIMAGTLVEVGKGRYRAGDLPGILAARDRRRAGITAPPHGLCLEEVWYQGKWGIGEPSPWPGDPEEPPLG